MKYGKLRTAWSVFCGLAAVLVILFWVRSYRQLDNIGCQVREMRVVVLSSLLGRIRLGTDEPVPLDRLIKTGGCPIDEQMRRVDEFVRRHSFLGFGFEGFGSHGWRIAVPYWLPMMLVAAGAGLPWTARVGWGLRFSLRSLLVATTAVAVVLGLVAWAGG